MQGSGLDILRGAGYILSCVVTLAVVIWASTLLMVRHELSESQHGHSRLVTTEATVYSAVHIAKGSEFTVDPYLPNEVRLGEDFYQVIFEDPHHEIGTNNPEIYEQFRDCLGEKVELVYRLETSYAGTDRNFVSAQLLDDISG